MMKHRAMAEIRRVGFRAIVPSMNRLVVVDRAAPFFHRGQGVVVRMGHRILLRNHGCRVRTT